MRNDIKVGIFFIVGLIILLAVFDFVGDLPFFRNEFTVKTYFQSIGELRKGNPVRLEGVEIGKVSDIKIADRKIEVEMEVIGTSGIREDSVASIRLTSLLGTSYVNLSFGTEESPQAKNGSVLESIEPASLNEILAKVDSAVGSIDSALSAFSALGENKDKISSMITNMDSVLGNMAEGKGTIGKLLQDEGLYTDASEALKQARGTLLNVNDIAASIKSGKGTLGKLLVDDSLFFETKEAFTNIGGLTKKLNTDQGTIGKLLTDDTLYTEATEAATNMNAILKKINSGEGTIGQLVNDDSLYLDAKDTLLKVDKSLDTIDDLAPLGVFGTALGVVTLF